MKVKLLTAAGLLGLGLLARVLSDTESPGRDRDELNATLKHYVEKKYFFDHTKGSSSDSVFSPAVMSQLESTYYSNCLNLISKNKPEIKSIRINELPSIDSINIYIFKDDPEDKLNKFRGNCAYVGFDNIIICDFNYMHAEILQKGEFDRIASSLVKTLFLWIVGHEIGHIAHDHKGKHFSFDDFTNVIDPYSGGNDEKMEREADSFAVTALGNEQVGFFFWMGLSQLAGNPELFGGKVSTDGTILLPKRSKTHPPLFLRIIENANLAIEGGYVVDNTGHFNEIRKRIKIVSTP